MDTTRNCTTCRLFRLSAFYAVTVLTFVVAKLVFMLCNLSQWSMFNGQCSMVNVVIHGLTLDLSTSLYFLIVPLLICMASVWWTHIRWDKLFRIYAFVVSLLLALAFVADTTLYAFWGTKLDASYLSFLSQPEGITQSVSLGFLALRLAIFLIVVTALYKLYVLAWDLRSIRPHNLTSIRETLLYVAFIPLMVIGIRGGLSESTTNIGQVYFSQNQFLNHAAINPVFNFLAYAFSPVLDIPEYHFMDDAESEQITDALYSTESIDTDSLLNTTRPNVVVILLESCGAIFTGLEGRNDVMPYFSKLMDESVSFDSCYANSWRTDRGTVCTFSGYPSFPKASVMKMPNKAHNMPCLARSMANQGYTTSFLYGGDINFTNMRSYLVSNGFEHLTSMDDFSFQEQKTAKWGVRDDITFNTLYDMVVAQAASGNHFLIGFLTLSTHEPWDTPVQKFDDEILSAYYYLDQCIANFVERVRQTPAWDDLLIILLPDHGSGYNGLAQTDIKRNHIPMVWTGGAVKTPRRITTVCNQTDLPATLLGQMHIPHDEYRFSRDVMGSNYTHPFAIHTYNNGISLVAANTFAVYDLDATRAIVAQGHDADSLIHCGQAVLQAAANDLQQLK